jgi:hypothetical protein
MTAGHTIAAIVCSFEKVGPAILGNGSCRCRWVGNPPTFIAEVFRRHQMGFGRCWLSYAILRSRVPDKG